MSESRFLIADVVCGIDLDAKPDGVKACGKIAPRMLPSGDKGDTKCYVRALTGTALWMVYFPNGEVLKLSGPAAKRHLRTRRDDIGAPQFDDTGEADRLHREHAKRAGDFIGGGLEYHMTMPVAQFRKVWDGLQTGGYRRDGPSLDVGTPILIREHRDAHVRPGAGPEGFTGRAIRTQATDVARGGFIPDGWCVISFHRDIERIEDYK
jgi:hypothetical protein